MDLLPDSQWRDAQEGSWEGLGAGQEDRGSPQEERGTHEEVQGEDKYLRSQTVVWGLVCKWLELLQVSCVIVFFDVHLGGGGG